MENILPIGTVVTLKNGSLKVMITARYPLYNYKNRIGYFDYSGCVFPSGVTDNQTYFFNTDDIEKVWFTGYIDENELKAQEVFKNQVDKIEYPHFTIEEVSSLDEL
ncbi:DUF4176 domain-containing protein [Streptococcus uberis]|uniref:DUF4176 domain-containing protein n=1 Tax=Streptococcus uberis TaxID=1349 RepID=UPI0019394B3E|nr:DUF4176 domain-containing protein [Streptococcus uberis]